MGLLTNAICLTDTVASLESEKRDIVDWLERDVVQPGSTYRNVSGYIIHASISNADLGALRALKARILSGDEVSLNTVSAIMGHAKTGLINEAVTIALGVSPLRADVTSVCVMWAVRGMERYGHLDGQLSGEDWKENSEVLVEAVLALISAGGSNDLLYASDNASYEVSALSLPSVELALLFINNRDRFDDIVDIITERWTTDPELVATVLHSGAKALSHGEL